MNASLLKLGQDIRGSYWFLPTLMVLAAIGLSFGTIYLDSTRSAEWIQSYPWLYYGRTEGARATLSAIAGSMITVAGVTFSMTIVAVSFASAQFGPRLIGNFMRDRGNQVTLGTFISTFVYSLLTLRTVRSPADGDSENTLAAFVPHLSVLTAILLALASVAVLIYYIHHIPETINIGNITAQLGRELKSSVCSLFPESIAEGDASADEAEIGAEIEPGRGVSTLVRMETEGYLQAVDDESLMRIACNNDLVLRIQYRPGDFVVEGDVVAEAWSSSSVSNEVVRTLRTCFACGRERTATQDTLFLVDQLVEIMTRALSPGLNDPFTASNCIDWLEVALRELVQREVPGARRYDESGALRVVAHPVSIERFAACMFDGSVQYVSADRNASLRMMKAIAEAIVAARRTTDREVLLEHAAALDEACQQALPRQRDRDQVTARHRELLALLADGGELRRLRDGQGWLGGTA